MCVFEYVYFARPDSRIFGGSAVYSIRKALGRQLAQESWVPADIVIPVPDSGVPAALGYAEGAGSLRNRADQESLCRPNIYRARTVDSSFRREGQVECCARKFSRESGSW